MLKKLYKHEFYSLFRNLFPIYAALGLFAVTCKLSMLIDIDNYIFEAVTGFSVTFYIISILAMFIVGMVIIVMRFYKNLLSSEGYLTFSLPFTATQHITCKLICAVSMISVNLIAVILSLLIVGAGTDAMSEIFNTFKLMFNDMFAELSVFNIILFILQIIVILLLSAFQLIVMFYAAMSIGQQYKSKIGGSVLAYIVLYVASEIFSTVAVMPFMLIYGNDFENYLFSAGINAVQIFLIIPMVLSLILITAYYIITCYFLGKKLNLE